MSYILALDQGTTSSRSILFTHEGKVLASAQQEFPQYFPQSAWVEHDAQEIWQCQLHTVEQVLAQSGIQASQIAALGVTNQRETTVLWDRRTGLPVHRALVWQDRRTSAACQALSRTHGEQIYEKTGLILDAYFSASKLRWLLDHIPNGQARAERGELAFGTIDSWLIWKLSGGSAHITDPSNASRTLLCNLQTGGWDEQMLALFNIPRAVLPRIVESSGVHAQAVLFDREIPIGGIAGDQQAALFGQACFRSGMAKNTYGTGCFLLLNTGEAIARANQLLSTLAWKKTAASHYALEGGVFIAGAVVQWLRDGLGLFTSAAEIEALAASVPTSDGVVMVPAFAGLGAPHWDPSARGTILGLTRGSTKAHIARAALEAIALQSADLLSAMQSGTGLKLSELRVDGGATSNQLLMQFQADILGVPVLRPQVRETTALGAAYLAGLAVGFWKDEAELERNWQLERRFDPAMTEDERQTRLQTWQRAVSRASGWV